MLDFDSSQRTVPKTYGARTHRFVGFRDAFCRGRFFHKS